MAVILRLAVSHVLCLWIFLAAIKRLFVLRRFLLRLCCSNQICAAELSVLALFRALRHDFASAVRRAFFVLEDAIDCAAAFGFLCEQLQTAVFDGEDFRLLAGFEHIDEPLFAAQFRLAFRAVAFESRQQNAAIFFAPLPAMRMAQSAPSSDMRTVCSAAPPEFVI
jgi:hypothetical protein